MLVQRCLSFISSVFFPGMASAEVLPQVSPAVSPKQDSVDLTPAPDTELARITARRTSRWQAVPCNGFVIYRGVVNSQDFLAKGGFKVENLYVLPVKPRSFVGVASRD